VARGASPAEAGYELYERESLGKLRLLQRFSRRCSWNAADGFASARCRRVFLRRPVRTRRTPRAWSITPGASKASRCGALIEERADGGLKASLRAKEPAYRVDLHGRAIQRRRSCLCRRAEPQGRTPRTSMARLVAAVTQRLAVVDARAPPPLRRILIMLVPPKELEGILLVDKPTDHTSHDVVARLRGKLKMRRIGHAGTLDPMATGLLIMLVGKATRVSQYLISLDKEYEGTIELGKDHRHPGRRRRSDGNAAGAALTEERIRARRCRAFSGTSIRRRRCIRPIKIDGVPLYKSARKGEEIAREPRFIRVMSWELTRFGVPRFDFRLRCTKGTYVRTLAHDLGEKLGCGAHLAALRRTATEKFNVSQALTLDQINALSLPEIEKRLLAPRDAVPLLAL
jgi:tRNA pseudouridine55 synthase